MEPNIIAIIQARTGSTRLPGKVLKTICGKPILELLIERLRQSKLVSKIVIATTINDNDDPIVDLAQRIGIDCFRGSEADVMGRFYGAAKKYNAEILLRITSDNILLDPETMDKMIKLHIKNKADYTHIDNLSFVAPEIAGFKPFKRAESMTKSPYYREHVTAFLRLRKDLFNIQTLPADFNGLRKEFRLTIDNKEDFLLLNEIYSRLYTGNHIIKLKYVYDLLDSNPKLLEINKEIIQKKYAVKMLVRVDGNKELGLGHVYRCLNLARVFPDNVNVRFLMREYQSVNELVEKEFPVELIDASGRNELEKTLNVIKEFKPDVVITDMLRPTEAYLESIKQKGMYLISIDDLNETNFCSDIIINGTIVRKYWDYKNSVGKVLTGPKYIILNRNFPLAHKKDRIINKSVKAIMVSMGGSDPGILAPRVLKALDRIRGDFDVILVKGSAYRDDGQLDEAIKNFSKKLTTMQNVENMAELMFSCDLAITSAGIIVYELACTGTPAIVLSQVESQIDTAKETTKNGTLVDLGLGNDVSEEDMITNISRLIKNQNLRQNMSSRGKKLVDGLGAERVAETIRSKFMF